MFATLSIKVFKRNSGASQAGVDLKVAKLKREKYFTRRRRLCTSDRRKAAWWAPSAACPWCRTDRSPSASPRAPSCPETPSTCSPAAKDPRTSKGQVNHHSSIDRQSSPFAQTRLSSQGHEQTQRLRGSNWKAVINNSSFPGKRAYHVEQLVKVLVVPAELQMVVSPDHALGRMELKRKSRPKLDKRLK